VNGRKVSDDVLTPAVSNDKKRSLYNTYDIGKFLRAGTNCGSCRPEIARLAGDAVM
jgi:bacterioferritin-associated ferredoxin